MCHGKAQNVPQHGTKRLLDYKKTREQQQQQQQQSNH
jgi:hypothetical protein